MPGHQGLILWVHRADAAHTDMGFVQDFVDGVSRSGNQRAENFGVGAEMMIFKRGVKHLVHRGVDAVSLLPGGLNPK